MKRRYVFAVFAVLVVVLILDSLATVDETEIGLATQFGRVVSGPLAPGLHWIAPRPAGGMLRIDRRLRLTEIPPTEAMDN